MLKVLAAASVAALAVCGPARAAGLAFDPPLTGKEAGNISGAACARPGACLLISDEMTFAREFQIGDAGLRTGGKVKLLVDTSDETDGEGVAFANGAYYVTGSHGVKKTTGERQASRYWVYRLKVDPATGRPTGAVEKSGRLAQVLAAAPRLKDHVDHRLADNGVNIEGLAVQGHDLYFGFRGPLEDHGQPPGKKDGALVMKVAEAAVFGTAAPASAVTKLKLGPGQGVRDLAAARGGLLILSGPQAEDDDPAAPPTRAQILFWNGAGEVVKALAEVPHAQGAKPESLTILAQDAAGFDLLVMCDGPAGGDPIRLRVGR